MRPQTEEEKWQWTQPLSLEDHGLYRHVIGKLRYVLPERYDLAYPMWLLSKRMSQPTYESMAQLKRLVRYLLGTTSLRLVLKDSSKTSAKYELNVYVDADYGGDRETRRSVSSCVIMMLNNPIMTYGRQQ